MANVTLRTFNLGWYPMGPRESVPAGSLRRAKGLYPTVQKSAKSRFGSTLVTALNAHSLTRFGPDTFAGVLDTLYRNGASILTGLSGARLSFATFPPQVGDEDSLFVAGGGTLYKVDAAGAVTQWGIAPPGTGFTAALATQSAKVIDTLDSAVSWTATTCTLADEATVKQLGTNSMKMSVAANTVGIATKTIAVDLTTFTGGAASSDADFIALWVRVDNPANLTSLQLVFDVGSANFATDTYTRAVYPTGTITDPSQLVTQTTGAANVVSSPPPFDVNDLAAAQLLDQLGQTVLVTSTSAWVRLRIPKTTFQRNGSSASTWANVAAVRLIAITNANGGVVVYLDDLELIGGAGLQGTYRYLVTYENSVTGSDSNPPINADGTLPYVEIANVNRQGVALAHLPVSTDPQVDARGIWRTVGNGTLFFKIATIADNSTLTYTDTIPDFSALDPSAPVVMSSDELSLDNELFEPTIGFVWGPYDGALWACGNSAAGARGRVYFSPAGRPESASGFIEATTDDDPTQCGFVYNGTNFVLTASKCYAIDGTGGVYTGPREIRGVPGTTHPFTVAVTPYGVFWQADHELILFDGASANTVGEHSVSELFNGQTLEGVAAFVGVVATSTGTDYYISDGTETLAMTCTDGAWRYLGVGCNALAYDTATGDVLASVANNIVLLEHANVFADAGAAIPFEIETPGAFVASDVQGLLKLVLIDIDTNGQTVTPTLILDEWVSTGGVSTLQHTSVALPPIVTTTRQTIEYPQNRPVSLVGVRLDGSLTAQVEVFGVDLDVYTPIAPQIEGIYTARAVATEGRQ